MVSCIILDFGYLLRDRLIKKWYGIGQEFIVTDDELDRKSDKVGKTIDAVIGKGLVPSYPIYILLLLNQYEAANNIDPKISSYGYLYQTLINNMLISINKDNDSIGIFDSYLCELAYYIFRSSKKIIDINDILEVNERFCKKYALRLSHEKKLEELILCHILEYIDSNSLKMKYSYIYYYFVAKYFSDNIDLKEIRDYICELSKNLYIEEYANIILFLCHLRKDQFIIDEIMLNSMLIFESISEFDFDNYGEFIKNMDRKSQKISLSISDDVKKNRDNLLSKQDEYRYKSFKESQEQTAIASETTENDTELNNILDINKAFKTLEILGQILKNYPGKIIAEVKHDIAYECHNLGMRILGAFTELIECSIDNIIENMVKEVNKHNNANILNIEDKVRKFLYYLVENVSVLLVKKVSDSISNDKLVETYTELLRCNSSTSFKIINMSIKFDCLNIFNVDEIIKLYKELDNNNNCFAANILRRMVIHYMYLHKVDYKYKQRICQELNVKVSGVTTLQLKGGHVEK